MGMLNVDCLGWEATKQGLEHVESIGDFDAVDVQQRRLREQAVAILADPRRVAAVQKSCPKYETEMRTAAASPLAPKLIVDPAASATTAAEWATRLTDEEVKLIKDFVGAEAKRRKIK